MDVFVSKSQHGGTVLLRLADLLVVQLPEVPTTGFRWSVDTVPAGTLIDSGFTPGAGGGVGGGGTRTFRFKFGKPGNDALQFKLWREWEGQQSVTDRFHIRVTVA